MVDNLKLEVQLQQSRILIVDDTATSRDLIRSYLDLAGYQNTAFAVDGIDAITKISESEPDIIILDLAMPRMNGFDVCRAVKERGGQRIPILVQTAFSGPAERTRAFEAGATDFITKPIHRTELMARVRLHLENRYLIGRLQDYRDRVHAELSIAASMQESLLPPSALLDRIETDRGLMVAAAFRSSSELGGDLWGLRPISDSKLVVYTFDFSGHGVTAALNAFRLHTLIETSSLDAETPAITLARLNNDLVDLLPRGQFATMFIGMFDLAAGRLDYAAAAAPRPIYATAGTAPRLLDTTGLPLGFRSDEHYQMRSVPWAPDSLLFLYSDAVTETPDVDGTLWEDQDLMDRICADRAALPSEIIREIEADFMRERGAFLADDLTLTCLRHRAT